MLRVLTMTDAEKAARVPIRRPRSSTAAMRCRPRPAAATSVLRDVRARCCGAMPLTRSRSSTTHDPDIAEDSTGSGVYDLATVDLVGRVHTPLSRAAARESGPIHPSPDGNDERLGLEPARRCLWELDHPQSHCPASLPGQTPPELRSAMERSSGRGPGDGTVLRTDLAPKRVVATIEVGGSPQSTPLARAGSGSTRVSGMSSFWWAPSCSVALFWPVIGSRRCLAGAAMGAVYLASSCGWSGGWR